MRENCVRKRACAHKSALVHNTNACTVLLYVIDFSLIKISLSEEAASALSSSKDGWVGPVYKITVGHWSISDHFMNMTAQIIAWSVLPSDH